MVLVQTGRTFKQDRDNSGEEHVASFLDRLPAGRYLAFREFAIDTPLADQLKGLRKKRPDFIVVGAEIGIVAVEVKNWNVSRNSYEWINQEEVEVSKPKGERKRHDNPERQRDAYCQALQNLVGRDLNIYVDAVLVFPTCSRAEFINKLSDPLAQKLPGCKHLFNLSRMIFREDLDQYQSAPEQLLIRVVRSDPRSRGATEAQVLEAWNRLLPQHLRVGGFVEETRRENEFSMLSKEQIDWVLNLDEDKNFLLDVAGSGKTNALVSKALWLLRQAPEGALPRILMTTYSENLAANLQMQFEDKLGPCPNPRLRQAVTIASMPALLERLAINCFGDTYAREPGMSVEAYEAVCKGLLIDAIESDAPPELPVFDWVLIDELQDFDNLYLGLLKTLALDGRFFAVGDVAQRIYDRHCDLKMLGSLRNASLRKSYRMYRTPRKIARLAVSILLNSDAIGKEWSDVRECA